MSGRPPKSDPAPASPESYGRLLANLASVLVGVVILLVVVLAPKPSAPPPVVPSPAPVAVQTPPVAAPKPRAKPSPPIVPTAPEPVLDRVAVAKAEAALDAASRDRARAEARADEAARALDDAAKQATADAASSRTLGLRLRDPGAQIARASTRGGFLKAERDRLKDEVVALRQAKPKPKPLADQNPVARPAGGDEYHFEVRRNRVTFIDLDQLLALVKADAQVRIRLNDSSRGVESKVGPVGSYSLEYVMGRVMPGGMDDLMQRRGISFNLRGWELVPEFEGRGESYESTRSPASEYARAIHRLNPAHATITMWVYPDGFALYRKLRDDLHARGYLVAARPLPEGMSIRGSPAGSMSAGQ